MSRRRIPCRRCGGTAKVWVRARDRRDPTIVRVAEASCPACAGKGGWVA